MSIVVFCARTNPASAALSVQQQRLLHSRLELLPLLKVGFFSSAFDYFCQEDKSLVKHSILEALSVSEWTDYWLNHWLLTFKKSDKKVNPQIVQFFEYLSFALVLAAMLFSCLQIKLFASSLPLTTTRCFSRFHGDSLQVSQHMWRLLNRSRWWWCDRHHYHQQSSV